MKNYINNLKKFTPLLSELVIRDIKNRYRKSVLGVFWTLLNPLLMMIVLSTVFSQLLKFGDVENFPVYILSGQVIFNFFSETTNGCMSSIIANAGLIKKIYVPKYMFTLSSILSSFINILASFTALIIVMVFMGMDFHFTMLLSFIPVLILVVFSSGIGFILASFAVKFRDIVHFYGVFLTAFMYLCPVIYPMSLLEGKPFIYEIVAYNPVTIILNMFRGMVMDGVLPPFIILLIISAVSIGVFALGLFVFYKKQDTFIMDI